MSPPARPDAQEAAPQETLPAPQGNAAPRRFSAPQRIAVPLGGSWLVTDETTGNAYPAEVPGSVQTDLLAAGVLPDPYPGENAEQYRWVGQRAWRYSRTFHLAPDVATRRDLVLECDGIDTLADITLNGQPVGRTDNMYRGYAFPLGAAVIAGENRIEIRIDSAPDFIARQQERKPLRNWGTAFFQGIGHLRKAHYHFGWDWAPPIVPCGIWKDLRIVAGSQPRLRHIRISQDHTLAPSSVGLNLQVEFEGTIPDGARLHYTLTPPHGAGGAQVLSSAVVAGENMARISVASPLLWWPRNLGDQPLYDLHVDLVHEGQVLDRVHRRVGLRSIKLLQRPDQWGSSFAFEANDIPFFATGGNWVPADCFPHRITAETYRRLVTAAADQNGNMLRVWGGGLYESPHFMDACDELGICVWHDFMFSCSTYPTDDPDFLANCSDEATQAVRRLHHHASMVLWCGNNELEEGLVSDQSPDAMPIREYDHLFVDLLGTIVARHAPGCDYIRSSGHSPGERRDREHTWRLDTGDAHLWWRVAGITQAAESIVYGSRAASLELEFERVFNTIFPAAYSRGWSSMRGIVPRFCSELGRSSFPAMDTIREFATEADHSATSRVMEYHQQGDNARLVGQIAEQFPIPQGFTDFVLVSQLFQGEFFRRFVELWRETPVCMGALFWCFNDCWPAVEWSPIDHAMRRKASFYIFRRCFAPILISATDDPKADSLDIFLSNNTAGPISGELTVHLTSLTGQGMLRHTQRIERAPTGPTSVTAVTLPANLDRRDAVLSLSLRPDTGPTVCNHRILALPKSLSLPRPTITARVVDSAGQKVRIRLRSDVAALWCELSLTGIDTARDCLFSDNFFHILPEAPIDIELNNLPPGLSPGQVASRLRARSFYSVAPHDPARPERFSVVENPSSDPPPDTLRSPRHPSASFSTSSRP